MTKKKPRKHIEEKESQEESPIHHKEIQTPDQDEVSDENTPEEHPEEGQENLTDENKIDELNDKFLRLYSEFDNYRKRTLKEKIDLSKTASADVITALLPVLDDFERAIRALSFSEHSDQAMKDGIILIYNKFLNILTQKGLEQMKTIGEAFNTDFHEAITNIPAPSDDLKGKVVDEVEKGYLLNGKVIRYAKVVVGS